MRLTSHFAGSALLLLSLSLATAGLGCSASAPEGAAPIARADYCAKLAKDACSRLVTCCNAAGITTTEEACTARETSACEAQATVSETAGRIYDELAAGNCLAGAALFQAGCATKQPGFWESRGVVDTCARVFHGRVPLGAGCKGDDDCAPSPDAVVGCTVTAGDTAAKCTPIPRANRGEKCNLTPDDSGTFVACKLDSICIGLPTTSGVTGETRCRGPAQVGEACLAFDPRTCADGLSCDPDRKLCTAPRKLGETCGTLPCEDPLVCQYTTNRCVAKIPLGESCRASDLCVDGAACVRGLCTAVKREGEKCIGSEECQSSYCMYESPDPDSGKCSKVYVGSSGGVDTSTCRAIEVK
ncbi:MAG: EB domain-containing protein [Polyangiales bacterium]